MIVDGVEPQAVREILELEADMTSERHKAGSAMFDAAGGFAPTLGIIGTVMGLVHVLGGLADSSPDQLGHSIASAFLATLYGVASANLLFLPIGTRLKNADKHEQAEKNLVIEAILLIQEGVNPNTLAEKLKGFLDKKELVKYETLDKKVEA
jgi:chemotaxis protein MotA